jgi:hypothetical protein
MIDITTEAIRLTHPEAVCIRWDRICYDKNSQQISIDDDIVDAKIIELTEEYEALQYQRDRQYPLIGDQLDMQYHDQLNGTTTWKDAIAKVKSDNPKE